MVVENAKKVSPKGVVSVRKRILPFEGFEETRDASHNPDHKSSFPPPPEGMGFLSFVLGRRQFCTKETVLYRGNQMFLYLLQRPQTHFVLFFDIFENFIFFPPKKEEKRNFTKIG